MRAWIGAVPFSSAMGLSAAIVQFGPQIFVNVWAASLWGDLVFIAGTLGTVALVVTLHRRGSGWAAVPAAFFATWLVYVASWAFTRSASGFDKLHIDAGGQILVFILTWGWPGILAMTAATWIFVARAAAPSGTGPTAGYARAQAKLEARRR